MSRTPPPDWLPKRDRDRWAGMTPEEQHNMQTAHKLRTATRDPDTQKKIAEAFNPPEVYGNEILSMDTVNQGTFVKGISDRGTQKLDPSQTGNTRSR